MSSQIQPQQQPLQNYPMSVSEQPPSHHSNGSFGAVFIVLAVIIVISAFACFLGRLCNRRYSHSQSQNQKPQKQQKQQKQGHHQNFRPKGGDIEIGFDKRGPSSKPNGLGHGPGPVHGPKLGPGIWSGRGGHKPSSNGDIMKGFGMKVGDDEEFRSGA